MLFRSSRKSTAESMSRQTTDAPRTISRTGTTASAMPQEIPDPHLQDFGRASTTQPVLAEAASGPSPPKLGRSPTGESVLPEDLFEPVAQGTSRSGTTQSMLPTALPNLDWQKPSRQTTKASALPTKVPTSSPHWLGRSFPRDSVVAPEVTDQPSLGLDPPATQGPMTVSESLSDSASTFEEVPLDETAKEPAPPVISPRTSPRVKTSELPVDGVS